MSIGIYKDKDKVLLVKYEYNDNVNTNKMYLDIDVCYDLIIVNEFRVILDCSKYEMNRFLIIDYKKMEIVD